MQKGPVEGERKKHVYIVVFKRYVHVHESTGKLNESLQRYIKVNEKANAGHMSD